MRRITVSYIVAVILCICLSCNPGRGLVQSTPDAVSAGNLIRYWRANDFPIPVRVDDEIDPRYQVGLRAAVAHWNARVGTSFLYVVTVDHSEFEIGNHCISVQERELGSSHRHKRLWGLHTPQSRRGQMIRSLIEFDEDLPDEVIYEVAIHELGHALGLAHDDEDKESIMYPYVMDHWGQVLRDEDVVAVRNTVPFAMSEVLEDPGDPFPTVSHVSAPTVTYPPPCPGTEFSVWLDVVVTTDRRLVSGPCIAPVSQD